MAGCLRLIWVVLALSACGAPDPLGQLEPGERGRVVRVLDGDALVLDTGQSVRLVGIEAPARPYRDRPGQPFQEEAKRMLEDMALGRQVQLHYAGLTRDRYERALAHVTTIDSLGPKLWLNAEMVRRGGARVRVYPDTSKASAPLLAVEREARENGLGLWRLGAYAVADASDLPDSFSGFQLVNGQVAGMQGADRPGVVCLLSLRESPLVLDLRTAAAEYCQLEAGTEILARGHVRGQRMEIVHALNVEVAGESLP